MSINAISGLLFSAVSGLLLWLTYRPHEASLSGSLDTMYWPRVVLWALLFSSVALVATHWGHKAEPARMASGNRADKGPDRFPTATLLCCAAYFTAIALLGFLISTLLFCAAFAIVLGYRDWKRLALFSCGVTVLMWLLVIKLMHVLLPRGMGIFRDVSLLFY
jgi:hypothetical protein